MNEEDLLAEIIKSEFVKEYICQDLDITYEESEDFCDKNEINNIDDYIIFNIKKNLAS